MAQSPALSRIDGPAFVRGLAILALAIGIGIWGALLFAPIPRVLPPTLDSASLTGHDTTVVARWFGGDALRVRVTIVGLITADDGRAAALLAVNSGTPKAYRSGQLLAPGVTLVGVSPNAVSIDQDGVIEQVAVPVNSTNLSQGFISVPPSPAQP